jgi:hypothetical protein
MAKTIAEIAAILARASKLRNPVPTSLAFVERTGIERFIERVGSAEEQARAGKALEKVANEAKMFDATETALRFGYQLEEPIVKVVRVIAARRALMQTKLWASLSGRDQLEVMAELFRRIDRQTAAALEKMAGPSRDASVAGYKIVARGLLREVHGRNVRGVVNALRRLRAETAALRRQQPEIEILDSALEGPVRLPTRLVDGERSVALGPDRLVGVASRYPQVVEHVMKDGTEGVFRVAGELDIRILVEVKGRTTASDGLRQVFAMQRRGTRGYVVIGGEVWLLKLYRPDQVVHFIVAPAGESLREAAEDAKALASVGLNIKVLEIDAAIEVEVTQVADGVVDDIAKHARSTLQVAKK